MPHLQAPFWVRFKSVIFAMICLCGVVACVAPPYEAPGSETSEGENSDSADSANGTDESSGETETSDDSEDDDCGFGQEMNAAGECRTRCFFDQCPPGFTCDETSDLCEPDSDSSDDTPEEEGPCDPENCPEGYTCPDDASSSECVPVDDGGCQGAFDCQFGETCVDGQCQPLGGDLVTVCTTDGDCPLLMTCQMGVCVGCLDDFLFWILS